MNEALTTNYSYGGWGGQPYGFSPVGMAPNALEAHLLVDASIISLTNTPFQVVYNYPLTVNSTNHSLRTDETKIKYIADVLFIYDKGQGELHAVDERASGALVLGRGDAVGPLEVVESEQAVWIANVKR